MRYDDFRTPLAQPQRPPKSAEHEAWMVANEALTRYKMVVERLPNDKTANLTCYVGFREFEVYAVGESFQDGWLQITTYDSQIGEERLILTPGNQVVFNIIVSKKAEDSPPPREIGFKSIMDSEKQG